VPPLLEIRVRALMLKGMVRHSYIVLAHLGGLGLLALSALDSSPLFIPLGNDLFFVALTAQKHELMIYYGLMATLGSVLGCLTDDMLSRKGGEKGLQKTVPRRHLEYVKKRTTKNAKWALIIASLMPPPFPFTAFVAGAAALQYPRKNLLLIVSLARFARYSMEGLLAVFFGRQLLRLARSPVLDYVVGGLIILSIAGSVLSIRSLIQESKQTSTT